MTHDEHNTIVKCLIYVIADNAVSDPTDIQLKLIKDVLQTTKWYCEENNLEIPVSYQRWSNWYDKKST